MSFSQIESQNDLSPLDEDFLRGYLDNHAKVWFSGYVVKEREGIYYGAMEFQTYNLPPDVEEDLLRRGYEITWVSATEFLVTLRMR